ncbi:Uncharacterised protein [Streptococcus pneumoniae]|nr:Uncharacterised protein [Streptococcus pneumoniae]
MLGGRANSVTSCTTNSHWNLTFTTKHVTCFSSLVDDIVHGNNREVHEGHIDDWTKSCHGCSCCCSRDGSFRNRTVTDTFWIKFFKHSNRSTEVSSEDTDVFSHQEHIFIATHFLRHSKDNGVTEGHCFCFHFISFSLVCVNIFKG